MCINMKRRKEKRVALKRTVVINVRLSTYARKCRYSHALKVLMERKVNPPKDTQLIKLCFNNTRYERRIYFGNKYIK